ncbi:MAG TPA: LamG domain-containing protein [Streptosporangiaceae bacterium]|nr:LamG domain-containing protein [Streptosporangiaceae bacterium]
MLPAARHHPRARRALTALISPLLAVGALAAATAPTAHTPPGASHRAKVRTGHASTPLTPVEQAQARARATHRPVVVAALTTPDSTTTAEPDGRLTLTQTSQPTRVLHHGKWVPLNAILHRVPGHKVSPVATAAPLLLSDGGSSLLAQMDEAGYTLSLSWPTPLPTPTLSGDAATYAEVLPGVDLVVTDNDQGGITPTLVIHNATAAANPALASIQYGVSAPGLTLGQTRGGDIYASASHNGDPVFTSSPAMIWDSTSLPAGAATVTEPDGSIVAAGSGAPATSTATEPGAAATAATVPTTVSGDTITLTPPASVLSSPSLTYPLYIDPSFTPFGVNSAETHWTQVDSGFPGTSYWDESSHLQVGYCYGGPNNTVCDNNNDPNQFMGHARSFFRMVIPQQIYGATIYSADIYMTDKWAPSCTKTPADLYTTGPIRPPGVVGTTTYANQPKWGSLVQEQSFAFGAGSSCGWTVPDVKWDVKDVIADNAAVGNHYQTFGLRAPDESGSAQSQAEWKQFSSGPNYVTMSVSYDQPPSKPDRTMSPAGTGDGGCYYNNDTNTPVIGNDDVTLYATASDPDSDTGLTTDFYLTDPNPAPGQPATTDYTVHGADQVTIPSDTIAGLHPGTEHTYYWYAIVTDSAGLTSPNPAADCYFTYNPNGPSAPQVTFSGSTSANLGATIQASFATPNCNPSGATSPCPVSYTYQLGVSAPITVSQANPCGTQPPGDSCNATWSGSTWSGPITMTQLNNVQLTVVGTAPGGNNSEAAVPIVDGLKPTSDPYSDGYFSGGKHPDLLLPGTNTTTPSLWLYPGTGDGTLGTPTDIGSLGNVTHPTNQPDGPADWADTQILHGDFTGHLVQDVMAYYPNGTTTGVTSGTAQIIGGYGDTGVLQPDNDFWSVPQNAFGQNSTGTSPTSDFTDPYLSDTDSTTPPDVATELVAAGNFSHQNTGDADVIGIIGDQQAGYKLDLWTTNPDQPGTYSYDSTLTSTAPETNTSWANYTLATVQPGCYPGNPGTCDPSTPTVFALNTTNGTLREATYTALTQTTPAWTPVNNVPWGASPPALVAADINASGNTELWTTATNTDGTRTATAYTVDTTVTSPALSKEATTTLAQPADDWPTNDGYNNTSATTATETINTNPRSNTNPNYNAKLTGNADWFSNPDTLGEYITLDGQNSYLAPPQGTLPVTDADPTISAWFKTTAPGGVIASLQDLPISGYNPPNTTADKYDPVLYVGTDGHLYAEWYTGHVTPITSQNPVDDGLWHHAILTTTSAGGTTTQTLTIDGTPQPTTITGTIKLQGDTSGYTNLTFGTGYNGGAWPAEPSQNQPSTPEYFQGQLANINYGASNP